MQAIVDTVAVRHPPRAPGDPLIGRQCGSYRIVKLLGRGGMGAVYLGEHPAIGSKVAIKVLHRRFADDPDVLSRFFNEARAANMIGHDNIVKVLDFANEKDLTWLIMECLEGPTLEALVKGGRRVPLSRVGPIALQVCRALQAAHDHQIIHRDLKPDNIFLVHQGDRGDFVKVVDFGIAKLHDAGSTRTQAGMVLGTAAYMSPEQAQAKPVDARADIYALGVMLYQMATGVLPFAHAGATLAAQLHARVYDEPPPPRSIAPDIPPAYEAVILRAMQREPENRYQSMLELQAALLACFEKLGISPDLPPAKSLERHVEGTRRTPAPAQRKRPALLAAAIAGTLALVAGGALTVRAVVAQRAAQAQAQKAREKAERAARLKLAREAEAARLAAEAEAEAEAARQQKEAERREEQRKAEEEAAQARRTRPVAAPVPGERVQLFLVANPPAHFRASWYGGAMEGQTPAEILVPKNMRVRIRYTLEGHAPFETTLVASGPQAVTGALK
jgi:tRNA A-37 threonylcarbamoyl transferase component Bud32